MKHYGVNVEKLPMPKLEARICRNKITDTDSRE